MKIALFGFNGEPMCFVHVLLNALDLATRGHEVRVVVEGSATKLVPELAREGHAFHGLYARVKQAGLFDGACKACSAKLGVLAGVEAEGLALLDDMAGHPGVARYLEQGYQVLTF
jgi:hypothetical protein